MSRISALFVDTAVAFGQVTVLRGLHGCRVDIGRVSKGAVIAAIEAGHLDAVRYICQSGYNYDTVLETADPSVASGRMQALRFLHEIGFDIRNVSRDAVIAAVRNGHLDMLRYIHQSGFDLKAISRSENLIVEAARSGHAEIVEYLHVSGCVPDVLSKPARETIDLMKQELAAAGPVYQPSAFWRVLNSAGESLLAWAGESNFKRTLNQGYFNFIPSEDNAQVARLRRLIGPKLQSKMDLYDIEDPDYDPAAWTSWRPNYQIFRGPDRARARDLYKQFVAMLYEYATLRESSGLLDQLEEPTLGNPIRVHRQGRLISQDLINSVRERNRIIGAIEKSGSVDSVPRIAELGAGYGRLGYVFLKTTPVRYFIFDIPPALYVSQWYLSSLFSERKIFPFRRFSNFSEIQEELSQAEIGFFTPNQLAMFPSSYFDASVTISSLHEMRREQITHFLSLMAKTTKSIIFLKQHKQYENPTDRLRIRRADYPTPEGFQYDIDHFDLANPGFFERTLFRK